MTRRRTRTRSPSLKMPHLKLNLPTMEQAASPVTMPKELPEELPVETPDQTITEGDKVEGDKVEGDKVEQPAEDNSGDEDDE